uniref:Mediator of RNA polymerase II transcription subunit 30 n=1 Tax=Sarcophilus harrisii TaxID=9305 RepID=G3VQQ6_SARHA
MSTPPLAGAGMPPGAFTGPQAQAAREVNTASLCRIGQETVQDIVYRTMEIFQLLRNMQLPNGVTYHTGTYQDRLGKLQDHLRQLSILFRKLRLVYDKCNENCAGLDPIPIEMASNSIYAKHDCTYFHNCCVAQEIPDQKGKINERKQNERKQQQKSENAMLWSTFSSHSPLWVQMALFIIRSLQLVQIISFLRRTMSIRIDQHISCCLVQ